MKAINTHIDNADVCNWGCEALSCMTYNNGKGNLHSIFVDVSCFKR